MRITFLCDYLHPKYGYQEFHLAYELAKQTSKEISIITTDRYFPFSSYEKHKTVLGERIHKKIFEKFDSLEVFYYRPFLEFKTRIIPNLKFFNLLFNSKCDVCFSHSSSSFNSLLLLIFSRFLPFKLAVDNHMHFVAHKKSFPTLIYYSFLKFINKYIASKKVIYFGVTKESCEFLKKVESVRASQIKLLPIGYPSSVFKVPSQIENFIEIRKKIRNNLNIDFNNILITQTGKLSLDKRPDLTIAASKYKLIKNNGHILFLGPHSDKQKIYLKNLIKKEINSNWKIHFIDNVEFHKLNEFYIASDLLSYPGGASLSCIEGAASGCTSVVAFTPEGQIRSKLGLAKVPKDASDSSFIETFHNSIKELEENPRDIEEIYKKSTLVSNLVSDFSYECVGGILLDTIKN